MLIFLLACLGITLLTLETMIFIKFHSYGHRLLPLLLGLVALYNFYLIVEYMSGATAVFSLLKDLLLINLLDVTLYYIIDFMEINVKKYQHVIIITLLLFLNMMVMLSYNYKTSYRYFVAAFCVISAFCVLHLAITNYYAKHYSEKRKKTYRLLFIALLVPSLTLLSCELQLLTEQIAMPLAMALFCLIFEYLFATDQLRDEKSIIKEELFQTLDTVSIIFDSDFYYLDASKKAKELFPSYIDDMRENPTSYPQLSDIKTLLAKGGVDEQQTSQGFFRCVLQEAYYNKKMRGYILTFTDISAQKHEAEMAMQLAKDKSDFLASMSHDLRSPLHAIIGGSEILLSRKEMSLRSRDMVNNIHSAGSNLLDIVNSILDFSKLEQGRFELHPKNYSLKHLLEEQANMSFLNLKDKDVEFEMAITTPFPDTLYGDELRVRCIFQNILSNAIKFTDHGSVKATVSLLPLDNGSYEITYTVADTGIGMSEQQLNTVFADYVSYASDQNKEGTGLGLSIVKKLSEYMGGSAKAFSDGKTGTTMVIRFLQSVPENTVPDMQEPVSISDYAQSLSTEVFTGFEGPEFVYPEARILLTDDMAVNRTIFTQMTEPWQFKVDTAESGQEAVEAVRNNHYDLVFLDQMMPIMSGTEAADHIREFSEVPLVLLTANISSAMHEESKRHGFNAFCNKPIEMKQLSKTIISLLPEALRKTPDNRSSNNTHESTSGQSYIKALEIYIAELKSLVEPIREYAFGDLDMYRNKTHGIKGISRQLGKDELAESAEIMEMAAKTDNINFIRRNFERFYSDLEITIKNSEEELAQLKAKAGIADEESTVATAPRKEASADETAEALNRLKTALESYEMETIEECFTRIMELQLSDTVQNAVDKASQLYADMEYETAAETIAAVITG